MRHSLFVAPLLFVTACAHTQQQQESTTSSDLPPDTAFRIHPHVGTRHSELAVILSPPKGLPVWSCEAVATNDDFGCPVATDWFRGPGEYEVLAELKTGEDVIRASRSVAVTEEGPVDVSLWFVEDTRSHLELAAGRSAERPSTSASGTLTRDQIRAEIAKHRPEIKGCYAGALQDSPGVQARVETWFLIEPDGRVKMSSARGAPNHPELVYCILAKVRSFAFPAPKGGTLAVSFPFVLSPE